MRVAMIREDEVRVGIAGGSSAVCYAVEWGKGIDESEAYMAEIHHRRGMRDKSKLFNYIKWIPLQMTRNQYRQGDSKKKD